MTTSSSGVAQPGRAAPFAITAPAQLALPAGRTGTTAFTVTNLTGRPLKVRLQPRATPPGSDAWYTVAGDTEVPMAVGATLSVDVRAAVPADAPAGSSAMTLRAVDEADPENLTDGPAVEVVVPAPVVTPPPRRPPWLLIAIAAAVLLLAGGALWWFVLRAVPPVNEQPPELPDTARVHAGMTAEPGTWRDDPALAYQWLRCAGAACTPIEGATSLTYTPVVEDAERELVLRVTATNEDGSTVVESRRSRVGQAPPVASVPPQLSGKAEAGQTLTLTTGTWERAVTVTQRWVSCPPGETTGCTPIEGATGTTLLLDAAHTGRVIAAEVTATNPGGETLVPSNTVGPVGVARVPVPLVVGLTLAQAQTLLDAAGLTAAVAGPSSWCSAVTSQSVSPTTLVDRGSAVALGVQFKPVCLRFGVPIDRVEFNPRFLPEGVGG